MRRSVVSAAITAAGALALVGPAVAEWSALQQLREGLSRCPGTQDDACGGLARADVDVGGLRMWHAWREHAGLRLEAERVTIIGGADGIAVDAHGVQLSRATNAAPVTSPKSDTPASEADAPQAPRRRSLQTHGIPVHLQVHGDIEWSRGGITVTASQPWVRLDGHGGAEAHFTPTVRGRGLQAHGETEWDARALDGDPRHWQARGRVALASGPSVPAALTLSPEHVDLQLDDGDGGQLIVHAPLPRGARSAPPSVEVIASRFSLSALGGLGARTLARWGSDLQQATLDGTITFEGAIDAGTVGLEHVVLDGLVVDHPKLARDAVHFDALNIDGHASWNGPHLDGELVLGHRGAAASMTANFGPRALDLEALLAPLPCADLVGAFPDAMAEMVAGTRLTGQIEGRAQLHVDREALAQARALDRRPSDAPAPGSLDVEFPFLERCTVIADDPRLDLPALSGPYRHNFVDDRGQARTRVMAPGAPGYVSLTTVPRLSRAFITLEDRRFWSHDGFDREQIVNAFWHNLVKGRVSRGASTISQQATRNLWLGVDRSWARKLQEALLTARLESSTNKSRIMELYLNVIELGPGTHGVDEAAQLYFGKPARALTPLQAVHIAALAPAPRRFAAEFADGRVDAEWLDMLRAAVRRMYRAGFISRAQMLAGQREDLGLLDRR
ncbi:MAG: transglycosylase domain-containing protein [Deltaproteobacteria bacterium]|nr:transglycosylase domain-containing protein [Deltaproteobacteria bacterium]